MALKATWIAQEAMIGDSHSKMKRALRNGMGASFTYAQLKEMAERGLLRTLAILEAEELCPAVKAPKLVEVPAPQGD